MNKEDIDQIVMLLTIKYSGTIITQFQVVPYSYNHYAIQLGDKHGKHVGYLARYSKTPEEAWAKSTTDELIWIEFPENT